MFRMYNGMHIPFFLGYATHLRVFQFIILQKVWCFGTFHMIFRIFPGIPLKKEKSHAIQQNKQHASSYPSDLPPKSTPPNHLHLPSPAPFPHPPRCQKNRVASRRPSAVPTEKRVLQTNVCAMPAVSWPVRAEGLVLSPQNWWLNITPWKI